MSGNRTTQGMLSAYAEREAWLDDHHEAMSCLDLEEKLVWGMTVFRAMNKLESTILARSVDGDNHVAVAKLADIDACYRKWLETSEYFLSLAKNFHAKEYEVKGIEDFAATVEEARSMIGNNEMEAGFPPIETLDALIRPENPDPERYGA